MTLIQRFLLSYSLFPKIKFVGLISGGHVALTTSNVQMTFGDRVPYHIYFHRPGLLEKSQHIMESDVSGKLQLRALLDNPTNISDNRPTVRVIFDNCVFIKDSHLSLTDNPNPQQNISPSTFFSQYDSNGDSTHYTTSNCNYTN